MSKVGDITLPLAEAWKRFSIGNANQADFKIILADLLEVSHHGHTLSYAMFLEQQKSLNDFPMYAALTAAQQEIGKRIIKRLGYSDDDIIAVRKQATAAAKASVRT
jgi:hypothetical protein